MHAVSGMVADRERCPKCKHRAATLWLPNACLRVTSIAALQLSR